MRLGGEKDLRAIEFGAHVIELKRVGGVLFRPFARFAQMQERGHRGEHDETDKQREAENILIGLDMFEQEGDISGIGQCRRRDPGQDARRCKLK